MNRISMMLLVILDIHGNKEVLEEVTTMKHDAISCHVDIMDYGPSTIECINLLMKQNN